jgi:hypothetical protein
VPIRPRAVSGDGAQPGEIDYRLARLALISEYEAGNLARHDVCDAHPELIRAAREVGEPTEDVCPICEEADLVLVRYVFGPRLPAHGRCITKPAELARIAQRKGNFTVYSVEACPACAFNHLRRSYPLKS